MPTTFGGRPTGERLERMQASPQWSRGRFRNPLPPQMNVVSAGTRWVTSGSRHRRPKAPPPLAEAADLTVAPKSGLRTTWLGHSSVLLELGGLRLLTDPVFGPRASPSAYMGPARFFPAPRTLDAIGPLDAVVLSHDHYDHLDFPTLRELVAREVDFLVPLGVGAHLEAWGVAPERITALDWWEETTLGAVTLTFVPARHFSGRGARDRDRTLWGGWTIRAPEASVYFSGDSGYFPGFAEIGERCGPFDLTLMESGAYDRSWADVHLGPEQALAAHLDAKGGLFMPIHWGTFDLALHSWTEPVERLLAGAPSRGVDLVIPRPGGTFELDAPPPVNRWWPEVPWQPVDEHRVVSSGVPDVSGLAPSY